MPASARDFTVPRSGRRIATASLMGHDEVPIHFTLGQEVQRRDDPEAGVGRIVGFVLRASPVLALVRWKARVYTFEPLSALIGASPMLWSR
jgi:hypothetical protein